MEGEIFMKTGNKYIVGYFNLHRDPSVNFQLNRWISYLGMDALDEIKKIVPKLTDFNNYRTVFLELAKESEESGKKLHAAYYYRSAEFFMWANDPQKQPTRKQFLHLVREHYNLSEADIHNIPYTYNGKSAFLSSYHFKPANPKDIMVIFGGSDSYNEEFLPILMPLSEVGYEIILFEGPGQGTPLEDYHIPMTHEWHKPVKAVLDYYQVDDVTLMGISMGGCMVMRAAAYEQRVKRVIAYDALYDANVWLEKLKPVTKIIVKVCVKLKFRRIINMLFYKAMKKSMLFEWAIYQAMHVVGVNTPYEYLEIIKHFRTDDISHLITQDVLVLAGTEDFSIPLNQFYRQIEALKNVQSLTARLFTKQENASAHCQIGNVGLVLDVITKWIDFVKTYQS